MSEPGFPHADVLQHAADGIAVICAATGSFIYTNDAWSHALGYESAELTGRHVSTVTAPSDRLPQELAAEMLEALERGGSWRGELELRRRDGSTVWWEQAISRYDDELGRPAWIVVGRDVGARRVESNELAAAEHRFRTAFDALPVAAALTDADGRLVAVNGALAALTGAAREELLGRSLEAVLEPVDVAAARALTTAGLRGDVSHYRVDARCGPAGRDAVAVTTTIVRGVDGRPLHAVAVVERAQASSATSSSTS
ncbi:MAG TPA: PAS domain S-box protein [Baekduia sp.]